MLREKRMKDERVGNGEIVRVKKEWEKNKYIYRERVGEGNIECVRVSEKGREIERNKGESGYRCRSERERGTSNSRKGRKERVKKREALICSLHNHF